MSLTCRYICTYIHTNKHIGGTLMAALELLTGAGANVVECACIVELKFLAGGAKVTEKYPGVSVWSLISEDVLQLKGEVPE